MFLKICTVNILIAVTSPAADDQCHYLTKADTERGRELINYEFPITVRVKCEVSYVLV